MDPRHHPLCVYLDFKLKPDLQLQLSHLCCWCPALSYACCAISCHLESPHSCFPLQLGNWGPVCSSSSILLLVSNVIFLMKSRICCDCLWGCRVRPSMQELGGWLFSFSFFGGEKELILSQSHEILEEDGAWRICSSAKPEPSSLLCQWMLLSSGVVTLKTVICNGQHGTYALLRYILNCHKSERRDWVSL